jgi:hypothetical protein
MHNSLCFADHLHDEHQGSPGPPDGPADNGDDPPPTGALLPNSPRNLEFNELSMSLQNTLNVDIHIFPALVRRSYLILCCLST